MYPAIATSVVTLELRACVCAKLVRRAPGTPSPCSCAAVDDVGHVGQHGHLNPDGLGPVPTRQPSLRGAQRRARGRAGDSPVAPQESCSGVGGGRGRGRWTCGRDGQLPGGLTRACRVPHLGCRDTPRPREPCECGRRRSRRCWGLWSLCEDRGRGRGCWFSCGPRPADRLRASLDGRPCAASSLLSRDLTSSAMSSATSRTTGLLVASLAIVGRKDVSFETQLDLRLVFFRLSSSDLHDRFPWSAMHNCLEFP